MLWMAPAHPLAFLLPHQGQGILEWIEGPGLCTYEGAFHANLFHGKGSIFLANGSRIHGHFSEGRSAQLPSSCSPSSTRLFPLRRLCCHLHRHQRAVGLQWQGLENAPSCSGNAGAN